MTPILPFWFKQRQCKLEAGANDHTFKVTAPNLGEAILSIAPEPNGGWRGSLRGQVDGPELERTSPVPTAGEAWDRAFELFRNRVIV